jgi:hypothetical protein
VRLSTKSKSRSGSSNKHPNKSGPGGAFSSNQDIVREVSSEEDSNFVESAEEITERVTSTSPEQELDMQSMADSYSSDNDDDLYYGYNSTYSN